MPRRKPPQMIALTQIFTMNKLNTPHTTIQLGSISYFVWLTMCLTSLWVSGNTYSSVLSDDHLQLTKQSLTGQCSSDVKAYKQWPKQPNKSGKIWKEGEIRQKQLNHGANKWQTKHRFREGSLLRNIFFSGSFYRKRGSTSK